MDYFQSLPPEVVLHIFGFLPAQTLLCAVSLVSKSFRDYAHSNTLWTTVRYKYNPRTVTVFQDFLRKQNRVESLTLLLEDFSLCCPDNNFPELSSLTKMVLIGSRYYNFIHLKNNYPNLKELELINMDLCEWSFHEAFQNGECHYENECQDERPMAQCSAFEHLCRKLQKLEKITITDLKCTENDYDETPCIEWNHLRFLGESLKDLKISNQSLNYSDLRKITESCTRLQTFHFETLCCIHCVSGLLMHLPLTELVISVLPLGSKLTREIIHRSLNGLFLRLPELVRCSFSGIEHFDDSVLQCMTEHCKKLEVIKLTKLPSIIDIGIMCLITEMDNLKELKVRNCSSCDTEKVLASLITNENLNCRHLDFNENDDESA